MNARFSAGDCGPPLSFKPNVLDLFLFAAAAWVPHSIHYDHEQIALEKRPGILIHRTLLAAWGLRVVDAYAHSRGARIDRAEYGFPAYGLAGEEVTIQARVESVDPGGDSATCRFWAVSDGVKQVLSGSASLSAAD